MSYSKRTKCNYLYVIGLVTRKKKTRKQKLWGLALNMFFLHSFKNRYLVLRFKKFRVLVEIQLKRILKQCHWNVRSIIQEISRMISLSNQFIVFLLLLQRHLSLKHEIIMLVSKKKFLYQIFPHTCKVYLAIY